MTLHVCFGEVKKRAKVSYNKSVSFLINRAWEVGPDRAGVPSNLNHSESVDRYQNTRGSHPCITFTFCRNFHRSGTVSLAFICWTTWPRFSTEILLRLLHILE